MRRDGKRVSCEAGSLSAFVDGLASGEAIAAPPALLRLAEGVLAQVKGTGLGPEDLVSELVIRLLDRARRGEPLLGAGVKSVGAVLRHRLWQIAIDHAPSRAAIKDLAEHVRRALRDGVAASAPRPERIERNGRIDSRQVRQAIAWGWAEVDAPGEPRALTRWLAREFGMLSEQTSLEDAAEIAQPASAIGGLTLARRIATRLGGERLALLRLRLRGASLSEAAEALGGCTSGACERMKAIEAEIATEVRALGAAAGQLREALRLFAASPSPAGRGSG